MNEMRAFFQARTFLSNLLQTIIIIVLTGLLAYGMEQYNLMLEDMKLLYLLAVLIVILQTESFGWTLFSTAMFVGFDALLVHDDESKQLYITSTIIFVVIALIVNVLALRLQKQMEASKESEQIQKRLYEASKGLNKVRGSQEIIDYANEALTNLAGSEAHVYFDISRDDPDEAKKWCLRNSAFCGNGELDFSEAPNKYIPIRSNRKTTGVAVIDCSKKPMTPVIKDLIVAFLTQISIAQERNMLEEKNKKESAIYAREKIKANVMRSLSNDMYPHIKNIEKMAKELEENHTLTEDERDELSKKIQREASYLSDNVDNAIEITSSK